MNIVNLESPDEIETEMELVEHGVFSVKSSTISIYIYMSRKLNLAQAETLWLINP